MRWLAPLGLLVLLFCAWLLTLPINNPENAITRVIFYYFQTFPLVAPPQTLHLGKEAALAIFNVRLQAVAGGGGLVLPVARPIILLSPNEASFFSFLP